MLPKESGRFFVGTLWKKKIWLTIIIRIKKKMRFFSRFYLWPFKNYILQTWSGRGCSTNTFVTNYFFNSLNDYCFPKKSLQSHHAPMIGYVAFSHKIEYITSFLEILNLKWHQNPITGTRVMAIWLNGWIFPIGQTGEASRWRVCYKLDFLLQGQK